MTFWCLWYLLNAFWCRLRAGNQWLRLKQTELLVARGRWRCGRNDRRQVTRLRRETCRHCIKHENEYRQ
jgi:hypothetical protein